ncbi:MAG: hypothetical protein R6X33_16170 [Candidatus Brocadiia bacterium]
MWELAKENEDVLRFSTLFTARQVPEYLSDDARIDEAIDWCRRHGITHLYLESFRGERAPSREVIAHARDRFREAGFMVSGCITPMSYGKRSEGWPMFSCYTSKDTLEQLRAMSERAAGLFDVVMIDDFLCSDCPCEVCAAAKGNRQWSQFKRDLMLRVSRTHIIEAGRAVNPNVEFIIKYPAWHEMYQERGYDVDAQSRLFPKTWVGTETRGVDPGQLTADEEGSRLRKEPQYRAYWLMRWLLGIGGRKCGGGWYDTIRTSPSYYVEQGRQTVLGGAREAFLFNFGAIYDGTEHDKRRGPDDLAALMDEMPRHFELARLIRGKTPRGLLGWKPPNSSPGPDYNLHSLLGMAGFPVTAAHEFDPTAPGFVFGYHVLHDPNWQWAVKQALACEKPIVATSAFLETARPAAEGNRLDIATLRERAVVVPRLSDRDTWPALEELDRPALDELRDAACEPLGVTFHAPNNVSLYLFDDDVAVIENFRDEPADCSLRLEGWAGYTGAVCIPTNQSMDIPAGETLELEAPPRTLVALRRADG